MSTPTRTRALDLTLALLTVAGLGYAAFAWLRAPDSPMVTPEMTPEITARPSVAADGRALSEIDAAAFAAALAALDLPTPPVSLQHMDARLGQRLAETVNAALQERTAEHYGQIGQIMDCLESWTVARACYETARQLDPDDHRWPHYIGRIAAWRQGQADEAAAYFRQAIDLQPSYAASQARLADLQLNAGQLDAARETLEQLLTVAPRSLFGHTSMARLALAGGGFDEARDHLNAALDVAPGYGPAHALLSQIFADAGDLGQSQWHARRAGPAPKDAVLFDDQLVGDLLRLADAVWHEEQTFKAQRESGEWSAAIATLRRLIDRRPATAGYWLDLAEACEQGGQTAEADRALARAFELKPQAAYPRIVAGRIAIARQEHEQGLEHAEAALARDSQRTAAHELKALALEKMGRLEESAAQLEQALTLSPPDATRLTWCARLQYLTGQKSTALHHAEQALSLEPDNLQANRLLARFHHAAGRYAQALPYAETCVRLDSSEIESLRLLSRIYFGLQRFDDARTALERGLQRFPGHPELQRDLDTFTRMRSGG